MQALQFNSQSVTPLTHSLESCVQSIHFSYNQLTHAVRFNGQVVLNSTHGHVAFQEITYYTHAPALHFHNPVIIPLTHILQFDNPVIISLTHILQSYSQVFISLVHCPV